jgi:hypothetical protein
VTCDDFAAVDDGAADRRAAEAEVLGADLDALACAATAGWFHASLRLVTVVARRGRPPMTGG